MYSDCSNSNDHSNSLLIRKKKKPIVMKEIEHLHYRVLFCFVLNMKSHRNKTYV